MTDKNNIVKPNLEPLLETINSNKDIASKFEKLDEQELFYLLELATENQKKISEILSANVLKILEVLGKRKQLKLLFNNPELFAHFISKFGPIIDRSTVYSDYFDYVNFSILESIPFSEDQIKSFLESSDEDHDLGKVILFYKLNIINKRIAKKYSTLYDVTLLRKSSKEIINLETKANELQQELSSKDIEKQEINRELLSLRNDNENLKTLEGQLQSKVESLQSQKKEIEHEYESTKQSLLEANKSIKALNDTAASLRKDMAQLEAQNKKLESENKGLLKKINEGIPDYEKELNKKIDELKLEKDKLNKKLEIVDKESKEKDGKIQELQKIIDGFDPGPDPDPILRQRIKELEGVVSKLQVENRYLQEQLSKKPWGWWWIFAPLFFGTFILLIAFVSYPGEIVSFLIDVFGYIFRFFSGKR